MENQNVPPLGQEHQENKNALPWLDLRQLETEEIHRGVEPVEKFAVPLVSGEGKTGGFLYVDMGDGAQVTDRHRKWELLRQHGFENAITRVNQLVNVITKQGESRVGLLTEDLFSENSAVVDLHDYEMRSRPGLFNEAAKWLAEKNPGKRATDPGLEENIAGLVSRLREKGWNVEGDNVFIQVTRTGESDQPYQFRALLGDLGRGVDYKPGKNKVEAGEFYELAEFVYWRG